MSFWLAVLAVVAVAASAAQGTATVDVGSRLEPMVDMGLIDRLEGATLELHPPRAEGVAVRFDKPWEGSVSTYVTVFKDGPRYRMYYRGANLPSRGKEVTAYAESPDGIHWTKPDLGLIEWGNTKQTNIVYVGPGTSTFSPFKDTRPGVPAEEQYKAIATGEKRGLFAFVSPDGLRWKRVGDEPFFMKGAFDSHNLAFWDAGQGQYVCYFRISPGGIRSIARCTSKDFRTWSEGTLLDLGDTPREHFYTNATTPYFRAPHVYFSFPKRFSPKRQAVADAEMPGVSDAVFMTSRDGLHFERRFMEALVRPGRDRKNWTDRSMMPAWGLVPTGTDEMSMYWTENYRHPSVFLRRGVFRLDGIVSVNGPYAGGTMTTKPLTFAGKSLVLNCSTSGVGSLRAALLDAAGKPLTGYGLDDCEEIYGDDIERVVKWKSGADLSAAGKPVRLQFALKDADLYSLRFR